MSSNPKKQSSSFEVMKLEEPRKQELILRLPGSSVHLMEGGTAIEIARGDFTLFTIMEEGEAIATIVRVADLRWPLTKDEPVVKLDASYYLFSLPVVGRDPLSYGVSFLGHHGTALETLDSFLSSHACFSKQVGPNRSNSGKYLDWQAFAPCVDSYNNFLAKAIAGGSGQIVRGMFQCSNAFANQVNKGGDMIITQAAESKNGTIDGKKDYAGRTGAVQKTNLSKNLKRVRKLSKMTEKVSKSMLNGIGVASRSVMGPAVNSQAGKALMAMVPGEVLLASLDAVNKIMDAAEAAEKQAFNATSEAARNMATKRFGENAGEAAEDAFATVGHCASTAWNVVKIRKAMNPASSLSSGLFKAAVSRNNNS